MSELTSRIDNLLAEKGLNRFKMEKDLGLAEGNVRRWAIGSIPNAKTIVDVAIYLDTTAEFLVYGENPPVRKNITAVDFDDPICLVNENLNPQKKSNNDLPSREEEIINIYDKLNKNEKVLLWHIAKEIQDMQIKNCCTH